MEGSHISNTSGRYYITEKGSLRREVFESTLVINQVSEKDFGLYTIRAENDQGRTGDTVLRLVEPGVPDAPKIIEAHVNSWDSAKLLWQPGFDGGSPQSIEVLVFEAFDNNQVPSEDVTERTPFKTFSVQLKPSSAKILGMIGLGEEASDLNYVFEEAAPQGSINELTNVTGLMPGQTYEVHMRGINHYGAGELSPAIVRFTTTNLTEPSDVYFNPLANALQFRPVDPRLCVRVAKTVDGGRTWSWNDECMGAGRGMLQLGSWPAGAVALAAHMCLIERPKTCTGLVSARARHFDPNSDNNGWSPFDDLDDEGVASSSALLSTPALILGVAAGIGATLVLLLVSIVVVCKRRKQALAQNKDYNLCAGRTGSGSGASSRGSTGSTGGLDDAASSKPVLLSAGSGGCYAAIDSVVSVQQHSGSASGVSGSSPLDMSELLTHGSYHHSSAAIAAFSSMPQQTFLPHAYQTRQVAPGQNGWSQSSTASGSTESAMMHVDDSGIAGGEDLTAMLRRICSINQQQQQQQQLQHPDNHSDHSGSGGSAGPLLYNQQQLNACQTPDPTGQQRRVRYEVVV